MQAAQSLSQVFLGVDLECASCHDSFINDWKLADSYALANVFANEPLEIHRHHQATGKTAETRFLFPELGEIDAAAPREERMKRLAAIVTSKENGRLARTIVNRLWSRFLGRGLVEPVDEMDGLPWNQELLDWLAADFVEHGYDLRHTMSRILTSRAYRLASVAADPAAQTQQDFSFRGPVRRRLSAEQIADSVSKLLHPLFPKEAHHPPASELIEIPEIPDAIQRAKWVWRPGGNGGTEAEPGTAHFQKIARPAYARRLVKGEAFLTADDSFELSVNGKPVGKAEGWETLHYIDFTEFLRGVKTTLDIRVTNSGDRKSPAGLFGVVRITYLNPDGATERLLVPTYSSWRVVPEGDAGEPFRSEEVAVYGQGPWKKLDRAIPLDTGYPGDFVRAVSVRNNPFLRALGRPVRDAVFTSRQAHASLLEAKELELTDGKFLADALKEGAATITLKARNNSSSIAHRIYREFLGRKGSDPELEAMKRRIGQPKVKDQARVKDALWEIFVSPEFQIIH